MLAEIEGLRPTQSALGTSVSPSSRERNGLRNFP